MGFFSSFIVFVLNDFVVQVSSCFWLLSFLLLLLIMIMLMMMKCVDDDVHDYVEHVGN